MIKLVNFIRSEVRSGNLTPDLSSGSAWEDDKYLQPVLEDDALLYSLDEIVRDVEDKAISTATAVHRVIELEKEMHRLQLEFSEYRQNVTKTLDRWNSIDDADKSTHGAEKSSNEKVLPQDDDSHYFSSYSANG